MVMCGVLVIEILYRIFHRYADRWRSHPFGAREVAFHFESDLGIYACQ